MEKKLTFRWVKIPSQYLLLFSIGIALQGNLLDSAMVSSQ